MNTLPNELKRQLQYIQESLGRIESRQIDDMKFNGLAQTEFKVFSQWGEDGIIQALVKAVPISRSIFVEFGVENYTEANTRFLLINNNWSGLIMDGSIENINMVKNSDIYWKYNIKAETAFITKDNINDLLKKNGITGEIGLLSIDIDGNDYWVWQAINVVDPAIVVVEYNYRYGDERAITTPYRSDFVRSKCHYSMIHYGASLKALVLLANKKGYAFVGCNSAGNNAFFVKRELKPEFIKELSTQEGFVMGKFRESRNSDGVLNYLTYDQEQALLRDLPVVDVLQEY